MTRDSRHVGRYDLVTPMIPRRDEILAGVERLLASGSYILGEEVRALEQEIAAACCVEDAVGVASGSSALEIALQIAGVGPGSEVITTAYTFIATIEAVIRLGATPVFVDIRPGDLNIDTKLVAEAITERTRVILPVHIFGVPCAMDELLAIAGAHDLVIVEDMCQAFGSLYRGMPCGSFGRMSCLSFYPTKNLPGIGDGGMLLCRRKEDADLARRLRNHETIRVGGELVSGWNHRLDEIQALAIRTRLARFGDEQADRDRAAALYNGLIPTSCRLETPDPSTGIRVTHHQYWIRVPDRGRLLTRLSEAGVEFGLYYDPPLHRHALAERCRISGSLEQTVLAGNEVLALPIHQALADDDAVRIGTLVREFLTGN